MPLRAPEIYETYSRNLQDAISEYCFKNQITPSEILEFKPLIVSRDGIGHYGEGFHEQGAYHDKPASAFIAHTRHPKQLINSLWRDSNNRFIDRIYRITAVGSDGYGIPRNPYDTTKWEVEYVELNPQTMQIVREGCMDLVHPTYKRMNLARFMQMYYCFNLM